MGVAALNESTADDERQIVRREGEYWTLVFAGETCRLRDTNGMRYLSYLLHRPHQPVAASEIERVGHRIAEAGRGMPSEIDAAARERARVNVTRALAGVLRRLASHHPELNRHLRATVQTGAFCTYTPDPRVGAVWKSEAD